MEPIEPRWVADPMSGDGALTGERATRAAAAALQGEGILIHPTSTVYGLGARPAPALDAAIARLKGRDPAPFIRLAADEEALRAVLPDLVWTETADRLSAEFWPGPLTLVMDDRGESVAVRVDANPAIRAVLALAGGLMTSTSLNVTGEEPARTRSDVLEALRGLGPVDRQLGWLDVGDLVPSPASTVVDVRGRTFEVLREGAVSADSITRALHGRGGGSRQE